MTATTRSIDPIDALSKADYDRIRSQLVFAPSAVMVCATLAVNATLLAIALALLADGSQPAYWFSQVLLPIVFFQAFSLLHDCGHGSFSSSRAINTWLGHYASILCFMPYFPWKYVHAEHHVWSGNLDHDPGLTLVKRAKERDELPAVLRLAWRTWLPIGAFVQHLVFWSHPLRAARDGAYSRERLARCAASSLLLPVTYVALHLLAPTIVNWTNFLPAIVAYLLLVELVNLPHHIGLTLRTDRLPLWKQHVTARSCNYPPVVSELLVLNFNFHIEHHLFPNLPWYRLRTARTLVKRALGDAYGETNGFGWHLEFRRRPFLDVILARVRRDPKARTETPSVPGKPQDSLGPNEVKSDPRIA